MREEDVGRAIGVLSSGRTKAVLVHGNADMDAVGSAYAIARCFPGCAVFAPDGLDRVSKMVLGKMEATAREGLGEGFDDVVVVDTSSPEQINAPEGFAPALVVDHHSPTGGWSNAGVFLCDESRTSCCEIVKEIIDRAGVPIPRDAALMLLGGMLTDSGHFQFARPPMLEAFADLMERHGIEMDEAMGLVEAEVSISERIAMLKAAGRVKYERVGQLIVASSSAGSFEASSCRALLGAGADVAFVGSQREGEFRISGRATQEAVRKGIRLGEIMSRVGSESMCDGGGHDGAAGLSGTGDVEAALAMCVENAMDAMRAIRAREDAGRLPDLKGRWPSPELLQALDDGLDGLVVLRVLGEVRAHRREGPVHAVGDPGLEVHGREAAAVVRGPELLVRGEVEGPAVLLGAVDVHGALPGEDDVPAQHHHRVDVLVLLLGRAVGLLHLPGYVLLRVEDRDVPGGVALGHLGLDRVHPVAALEAGQEGGVEGYGLPPPELVRRVPGEHVGPALVQAGVAEVHVHVEDVRGLEDGVEQLGGVDLGLVLGPAHDRHGPLDAGERRRLPDVDDHLPVPLVGDHVAGVPEDHAVPGHAEGYEAVLHVPGAGLDVAHVAAELVVDVGVPVGPEYGHLEARVAEVPYLLRHEDPPEVDEPRGLEPYVRSRMLLGLEERPELLIRDGLHRVPGDEGEPLFDVHGNRPPMCDFIKMGVAHGGAMELRALRESVLNGPVVDVGGYPYFVSPLSDGVPRVEPEALAEAVDGLAEAMDLDCDVLLAPEAMGIPVAAGLALRTGLPFLVARRKPYGLPGEIALTRSTGYSVSGLYINGLEPGERVAFVDDVLDTGGTLRAVAEALRGAGVELTEAGAVFCRSRDPAALSAEVGVPLRWLLRVGVRGGRPAIIE